MLGDSRRGITSGTPVPRSDREKSNGAGPVITYQLSPEELEHYRSMDVPKGIRPRLYTYEKPKPKPKGEAEPVKKSNVAKENFLRLRAQGLGRGRSGKELGLGPVELHLHLQEWGIEHRDDEQKEIEVWKQEHPDTAPVPSEPVAPQKMTSDKGRADYLECRANGLSRSAAFAQIGLPKGSTAYLLKKWDIADKDVEAAEIAKVTPLVQTTVSTATTLKGVAPATSEPVDTGEKHDASSQTARGAPKPESQSKEITPDTPEMGTQPEQRSPDSMDKHETREVTVTVRLDEKVLQSAFGAIVGDVYDTAIAHGWHEDKVPLPVQLALIHSEVSEALEADRKHLGNEAIAEELADVVIRVMDTAAAHDLDLPGALFRKMAENKDREFKHGGRKY